MAQLRTQHDPATGCLNWLGTSDHKGPRFSSDGRWVRARPVVVLDWHARAAGSPCPIKMRLRPLCQGILGLPSPSLCVSPFHAVPTYVRGTARRLGLEPDRIYGLAAAMKAIGLGRPGYTITWDASRMQDVVIDSVEMLRFAADHECSYWHAWLAWSYLLRNSAGKLARSTTN